MVPTVMVAPLSLPYGTGPRVALAPRPSPLCTLSTHSPASAPLSSPLFPQIHPSSRSVESKKIIHHTHLTRKRHKVVKQEEKKNKKNKTKKETSQTRDPSYSVRLPLSLLPDRISPCLPFRILASSFVPLFSPSRG